MDLYERDFHAWAFQQAEHVKRRSANELDWDNIAEELESLGKQQRSELRSRYEVLILHLLKWLYQPGHRSRSWSNSIEVQRSRITEHLAENPSLKSSDAELFEKAYRHARLDAATETGLDKTTLPESPPFDAAQALDPDYWPDAE